MKFTLNGCLYSIKYDRRNKVALCNGNPIPMNSFKRAQRIYMDAKRGRK